MTVMPGTAADVPQIISLLERVKLETSGIPEELSELWVLKEAGGEVVGCVALEIYGETGLLRSLAVAPSRRGEGLGLGLYLSREFVARHGGQIWAESREGQGSAFFFTLPLEAEQQLGLNEQA